MGIKKTFNQYIVCGEITKIILENRKGELFESLIDTKNLDRLIKLDKHWHLEWNRYTQSYYVKTSVYIGFENGQGKSKTLRLHNFLLGTEPYQRVDHENHNTLDNREFNIREVSVSNNGKHREGLNINNKSGYRNVCWISGWWRIQLQIDGKNHLFPEKFEDVDKAGLFAEEMRLKYYGEFAGE